MVDLQLRVDDIALTATWTGENSDVQAAIRDACPIHGEATKWGDELYIMTDVDASPETTQTIVEPGSLAYWPAGPAICLFWGPTPVSSGAAPEAASPVAVIATINDISPLATITENAILRLETVS